MSKSADTERRRIRRVALRASAGLIQGELGLIELPILLEMIRAVKEGKEPNRQLRKLILEEAITRMAMKGD